jgi:toxin CptA
VALWRCDVRVSWRTQIFSLVIHGILTLLILLSPWPENYGLVWVTLITLVVFECIRSQRNIMACRGELVLQSGLHLRWHNKDWLIRGTPWMLKSGILISLRQVGGRRTRKLWLAADSMDQREWRSLRQALLHAASVQQRHDR